LPTFERIRRRTINPESSFRSEVSNEPIARSRDHRDRTEHLAERTVVCGPGDAYNNRTFGAMGWA
jgi:hypothetical protein